MNIRDASADNELPRFGFFERILRGSHWQTHQAAREVALNYWYDRNDIMVLPNDLIAFAWSAPMRELAAKVGLSDVGLKKLLKGFGVVTPPQGHWNRGHAGRKRAARD